MVREVIRFEQRKGSLLAARIAKLTQVFDRGRKETANPLFLKKFFEFFSRRDGGGINRLFVKLAFGSGEIESQVDGVAATLLAASMLDFVQHEAVRTQANESAQAASGRIKAREQIPLQQFRKKSLSQILRFVRRRGELQTKILEDGLPVRDTERVERSSAFGGVIAAGRLDDRPAGWREIAAGNRLISLHFATESTHEKCGEASASLYSRGRPQKTKRRKPDRSRRSDEN